MAFAPHGLSSWEAVKNGALGDSAATGARWPWPSAHLAFDSDGGLTTRSGGSDGSSRDDKFEPSYIFDKLEPAYIQVKSVGFGGPAAGTRELGLLSDLGDHVLCQEVGGGLSAASIGSIGHPHSCAAACKYRDKARGCKDGMMCAHCHECRWSRYALPNHRGSRAKKQKGEARA